MAWDTTLVTIVRHLINDIDAATYTNSRIKTSICIAAQLCMLEIVFDNTYTIDIDNATITPDPFTLSTVDNGFINLVAFRAAWLIIGAEAKAASKMGIRVTDGPSTIDISGRLSSALGLEKSAEDRYNKAKVDYSLGGARGCLAVVTPYTVPYLDGGNGLE